MLERGSLRRDDVDWESQAERLEASGGHAALPSCDVNCLLQPHRIPYAGGFQESVLCQLQSYFCGEVSIVPPAVGHEFPILRQGLDGLIHLALGNTPRALNVSISEGLAAARIENHEVELARFDRLQYVVSLLLGLQFAAKYS